MNSVSRAVTGGFILASTFLAAAALGDGARSAPAQALVPDIAITVKGAEAMCSTRAGDPITCDVSAATPFTVSFFIDSVAGLPDVDQDTVAGIAAFQVRVDFSTYVVALKRTPNGGELGPEGARYWPSCDLAKHQFPGPTSFFVACIINVPGGESDYTGHVAEMDFACVDKDVSSSMVLVHGAPLHTVLVTDGGDFVLADGQGPTETLTINCVFPWDTNGDNVVSVHDIYLLVQAFGQAPPTNPVLDVTGDGAVSIEDISASVGHFGEMLP